MQTIYAGNMKKSACIRSQLEACKIGQKVKKIVLKSRFLPLILKCCQIYTFVACPKLLGAKDAR